MFGLSLWAFAMRTMLGLSGGGAVADKILVQTGDAYLFQDGSNFVI